MEYATPKRVRGEMGESSISLVNHLSRVEETPSDVRHIRFSALILIVRSPAEYSNTPALAVTLPYGNKIRRELDRSVKLRAMKPASHSVIHDWRLAERLLVRVARCRIRVATRTNFDFFRVADEIWLIQSNIHSNFEKSFYAAHNKWLNTNFE